MFDLGFSELLIIGIITLLVVGPERLPKVARTAGQWLGRLNRYVSQVKQDIDRDIKLDELRKMQQDMKDTAQRYEILAQGAARQAEEAVEQEAGQISKAMSASDGGQAIKEGDEIKEEEAAAALPEEPALLGDKPAESAQSPSTATDGKLAAENDAKAA